MSQVTGSRNTDPELVSAFAKKADISPQDAKRYIAALFSALEEVLMLNVKVGIRNFGIFRICKRKNSKIVNPKTGRVEILAQIKMVRFNAGRALKARLNDNVKKDIAIAVERMRKEKEECFEL